MARAPDGTNRVAITVCVILATLMQALDTTIANVALPYMQGSVSASQDQIDWVLTSYIVAAAIMTPPTGFLAGRFGTQAAFSSLHCWFHGRLDDVRHGAVIGADCAVSCPARPIRCRARTALANYSVQHQFEGTTGKRNGGMGCRGYGRSRAWASTWGLSDLGLQLALCLLHQPADRYLRLLRYLRFSD